MIARLRNAVGAWLGYGWCYRCKRSWWYATPGRGVSIDEDHAVTGRDTGSRRFTLCADCERGLPRDALVAWDQARLRHRERRGEYV